MGVLGSFKLHGFLFKPTLITTFLPSEKTTPRPRKWSTRWNKIQRGSTRTRPIGDLPTMIPKKGWPAIFWSGFWRDKKSGTIRKSENGYINHLLGFIRDLMWAWLGRESTTQGGQISSWSLIGVGRLFRRLALLGVPLDSHETSLLSHWTKSVAISRTYMYTQVFSPLPMGGSQLILRVSENLNLDTRHHLLNHKIHHKNWPFLRIVG